jgi:hypothetical protein
MKLIAAASLAFMLAGCAAQAAQGAGAPRAAAPAAQLQSCQRDDDCEGNRSCIEGYCRKVF